MASKSIRAIRNAFPAASLHLLTSTEASVLARNYNFVDHVWSFPIREYRRNKRYLFSIMNLIRQLRKMEYDAIMNLYAVQSLPGAFKMGALFLFLKAKIKIGFNHRWFSLFLTQGVPAERFQQRHLVDAMLDVALLAGGIPDEKGIEVFWDKNAENKWGHIFTNKEGNPQIAVGINFASDRKNKIWSPDNFACLADKLIGTFQAKVILLGGPGEEYLAHHIEGMMKNKVDNLAGRLALAELPYIISHCNLLISADSGPLHIGAAVGTPLVAIFGPSEASHASPYTSPDLFRIVQKDVPCRPCPRDYCDKPICMEAITPDDVFEKCMDLLQIHK